MKLLEYTLITMSIIFGVGSVVLLILGGSYRFFNFGWSEPEILIWDAFLSFLFFLQHSGMVRRSFRERLAVSVPTRYQGAVYSIASGIALALFALLAQRSQIVFYRLEGGLLGLATVCSVLAVGIFVFSAYSLRTFDPLGVGPIRAHLRGRDHRPVPFVVRGPYQWVRHPLYSCVLVLFWTTPVMSADHLLVNILWSGWIYCGTVLEERDLVAEFGDAYVQYQHRVPMLIPWRGRTAVAA